MPNWLNYLAGWITGQSGEKIEKFVVPPRETIHFLGEQDGITERYFKEAVVPALRQFAEIRNAYLAVLNYGGETTPFVALCVRTDGQLNENVVVAVGNVFHGMFNRSQHLDIMALNDETEPTLLAVCQPFYRRDGTIE